MPKQGANVRTAREIETAERSVRASLKKLQEEKEASKAFEQRLASEGEARILALQGLRRAKKRDILANIIETIENNETNENENDSERLERLERAKQALELTKELRATKKRNETRRKGEKKFKLDPFLNAEALYEAHYQQRLEKGDTVNEAKRFAAFHRNAKADPLFRALNAGKGAWGDLTLEEEPVPRATRKKQVMATVALEEVMPAPLLRSYASVLRTRKADYRQLALIGLPNITSAKGTFDIRAMKRQVYGKLGGKEIFPELTKDTAPIEHIYISAKTDMRGILAVSAFVTYRTHELAKRALQYHQSNPILFKYYEGSKEVLRAPMIDQARKEDEKRSFVSRE